MLRQIATLMLVAATLLAAARTRLYLKDGSDQIVREYKVLDDRVRYYSLERGAWEEIPLEFVDLDRTRRQEKQEQARREVRAREDRVEREAERRARTELHSVPIEDGVYYLDGESIVPVQQAEVVINGSKKHTFLQVISPLPVVAGKTTVELEGPASARVVDNSKPMFYLRLEKLSRFGIVSLKDKKKNRVVQVIKTVPKSKETFEEQEEVEVFRQQLAPNVYKIWPVEPIAPGEYAVVEFSQGEGDIRAWDFRYQTPPVGGK